MHLASILIKFHAPDVYDEKQATKALEALDNAKIPVQLEQHLDRILARGKLTRHITVEVKE